MLVMWSVTGTIYELKITYELKMGQEDSWKLKITCFCKGLHMYYVNKVPSIFENVDGYINMWRAVLFNDVFHELYDVDRL